MLSTGGIKMAGVLDVSKEARGIVLLFSKRARRVGVESKMKEANRNFVVRNV
jgi:hypothetical protein